MMLVNALDCHFPAGTLIEPCRQYRRHVIDVTAIAAGIIVRRTESTAMLPLQWSLPEHVCRTPNATICRPLYNFVAILRFAPVPIMHPFLRIRSSRR